MEKTRDQSEIALRAIIIPIENGIAIYQNKFKQNPPSLASINFIAPKIIEYSDLHYDPDKTSFGFTYKNAFVNGESVEYEYHPSTNKSLLSDRPDDWDCKAVNKTDPTKPLLFTQLPNHQGGCQLSTFKI
jgi:hypothetical protein